MKLRFLKSASTPALPTALDSGAAYDFDVEPKAKAKAKAKANGNANAKAHCPTIASFKSTLTSP